MRTKLFLNGIILERSLMNYFEIIFYSIDVKFVKLIAVILIML